MLKRPAGVVPILLLCGLAVRASAMGEVIEVTKKTQAKLGLVFTLAAERVDEQAVLVRMEIPRTGKLKALRSVGMRIGPGRPIVYATLQPTPGRGGSWSMSFQVSPELADKCSIDLTTPHDPPPGMSYLVYAVELKDYITERKQGGR